MIVINSEYVTVGISYGDPNKVRNGEQLKRTKSMSIRFKGLKKISAKTDTGDMIVGRNIVIENVKNKVGKDGRSANFFYAYNDYGATAANKTDVAGQLVDLGLKQGLVERKGAWYIYGDTKVQGMDSFVETLVEEDLLKDLEADLNKKK